MPGTSGAGACDASRTVRTAGRGVRRVRSLPRTAPRRRLRYPEEGIRFPSLPQQERAGRDALATGHEAFVGAVDLAGRRAPDLAHALEDQVEAVDVRLAHSR